MQKHFHAASEFTWYVVRESDDEVLKSSVASADTFESAISDSARSLLFLYSSSFISSFRRHAAFWYEFETNAHAKRFLPINFGEGTACTCAPLRLEACASRPYRSAFAILSARKHAHIIGINTFDGFQAYLFQDQLFSPPRWCRERRKEEAGGCQFSKCCFCACVCVCVFVRREGLIVTFSLKRLQRLMRAFTTVQSVHYIILLSILPLQRGEMMWKRTDAVDRGEMESVR